MSSTVSRSVPPSPLTSPPGSSTRNCSSTSKATSTISASRRTRARLGPTTLRMRATALGSAASSLSISSVMYSPSVRHGGGRRLPDSVDVLHHRQTSPACFLAFETAFVRELADELVNEAAARLRGIRSQELHDGTWFELHADTVDPVAGIDRELRRQTRGRPVRVQGRDRTGE